MVSYESVYPGTYSPLIPKYNQTGYQAEVAGIGMSLDPRTANQLGELNNKMNPGTKNIEIQGTSSQVWESVPEQHLTEMKRLMKLAEVKPSFHGPIVEASGVGERGWDEANRLGAEEQLKSALLRAHKLDPNGNISVTTHSTAQLPEMRQEIKTKDGKKLINFYVIDPESGKMGAIPIEKTYFPEQGKFEPEKEKKIIPEKALKKLNEDMWINQLSDINRQSSYGEQMIEGVKKQIPQKVIDYVANRNDINNLDNEDREIKDLFKVAQREINHGQIYLKDSYRNLRTLFDKVYPVVTGENKEKLNAFAQKIAPIVKEGFENDVEKLEEFGSVIEEGIRTLKSIDTPEIFKPLDKFVIEKSSETFANVAEEGYNKFGEKAPILNIENPPAGGGLSRAEDIKAVVKATRKQLSKNLVENKNIGKSEADKIAEKLIGATWDVGHINMIRKKGFSEKDVIKETEIIAPYVKHIHVSDNFGLDHTELPMGMGNVPMKEIMKKLGKKGFEAKKIIEAGNWWQYFAEKGGGNPFKPSIEAFDSPIYSMKAGPTWAQAGAYGSYYSGFGPTNPPIHHSIYGSGFQALPSELGGEIPGQQSRFSGTPNQ